MKIIIIQAFKSKIDGLENAVFKSGAMKHAAQFTKMLEKNCKVHAEDIQQQCGKYDKGHGMPNFWVSSMTSTKTILNLDGTTTQEKVDKMDIYMLKKDYELIHNKKAEFIKKVKHVFPIILDQCSPSLRFQLEDT